VCTRATDQCDLQGCSPPHVSRVPGTPTFLLCHVADVGTHYIAKYLALSLRPANIAMGACNHVLLHVVPIGC
jgi:hypothetical protein